MKISTKNYETDRFDYSGSSGIKILQKVTPIVWEWKENFSR